MGRRKTKVVAPSCVLCKKPFGDGALVKDTAGGPAHYECYHKAKAEKKEEKKRGASSTGKAGGGATKKEKKSVAGGGARPKLTTSVARGGARKKEKTSVARGGARKKEKTSDAGDGEGSTKTVVSPRGKPRKPLPKRERSGNAGVKRKAVSSSAKHERPTKQPRASLRDDVSSTFRKHRNSPLPAFVWDFVFALTKHQVIKSDDASTILKLSLQEAGDGDDLLDESTDESSDYELPSVESEGASAVEAEDQSEVEAEAKRQSSSSGEGMSSAEQSGGENDGDEDEGENEDESEAEADDEAEEKPTSENITYASTKQDKVCPKCINLPPAFLSDVNTYLTGSNDGFETDYSHQHRVKTCPCYHIKVSSFLKEMRVYVSKCCRGEIEQHVLNEIKANEKRKPAEKVCPWAGTDDETIDIDHQIHTPKELFKKLLKLQDGGKDNFTMKCSPQK